MSNKYKILFPNSSKDQVTIYGEEKTLLSTIRSGQPTLSDYFFLDKDDKIIEQDKEEKFTIKEVLKDKSQIYMNKKKEGSKEPKT